MTNLEMSWFLQRALTLTHQLKYYKLWQRKVVNLVGRTNATNIFSRGIHILSAGSSDFMQNYYINPLLNRVYSPAQFSDILMKSYSTFVQVQLPLLCTIRYRFFNCYHKQILKSEQPARNYYA